MKTIVREQKEYTKEYWGATKKKKYQINEGYRKQKTRAKSVKPKRKQLAAGRRLSYAPYMSSPAWRERRERYFQTHEHACVICGHKKSITLHHMSYEHLGAERDDELVPLCLFHHGEYHDLNGVQTNMVAKTKAYIASKRV